MQNTPEKLQVLHIKDVSMEQGRRAKKGYNMFRMRFGKWLSALSLSLKDLDLDFVARSDKSDVHIASDIFNVLSPLKCLESLTLQLRQRSPYANSLEETSISYSFLMQLSELVDPKFEQLSLPFANLKAFSLRLGPLVVAFPGTDFGDHQLHHSDLALPVTTPEEFAFVAGLLLHMDQYFPKLEKFSWYFGRIELDSLKDVFETARHSLDCATRISGQAREKVAGPVLVVLITFRGPTH